MQLHVHVLERYLKPKLGLGTSKFEARLTSRFTLQRRLNHTNILLYNTCYCTIDLPSVRI
jgi:hypothetical protein